MTDQKKALDSNLSLGDTPLEFANLASRRLAYYPNWKSQEFEDYLFEFVDEEIICNDLSPFKAYQILITLSKRYELWADGKVPDDICST